MNVYSRALRHIDMNDVKKKHHQKLLEKKILEEEYKKLLDSLKYNNSPEYSNWRSEITEQMTTADVFTTTLPATGDVEYPVSDTSTQIDDYAVEYTIDTSVYDTLVFDVTLNGDKTLAIFSSDLNLIKNITSSGIHSFTVDQSKQLKLITIVSLPGEGSVSVNDIRAKRQTPLNVVVPLNSPEATSFIRSDPNMSDLSPEEKQKKLKEMLEASDEYVEKILGSGFPGSGAVAPGEYDPFAQAPPGKAGDTPGVQVTDVATSSKTPETKSITPEQQSMIDRAKSYNSPQLDDQMKEFAKKVSSMNSTRRSNLAKSYHARAMAQMEAQARGEFSWNPSEELATSIRSYELLSGQKFDGKPLASYSYVNPKNPNQQSPSTSTPAPKDPKDMTDAELAKSGYYRGSDGKIYPISGLNDKPTPYDAADPVNIAFNGILARLGFSAAKAFMDWANKGKNQRIPNEDAATLEKLWADDAAQRGQSDVAFARGDKPGFFGRPDQAFNPFRPASKGGPGSGPTPLIRQLAGRSIKPGMTAAGANQSNKKTQKNSYEPEGQLISERRKLKSPEQILNKIPGYYDGKPAPLGFPETPPPEMVNGMHPDLVDGKKVADRFNRMDPESAKVMPLTGNPHIDKKVKEARKKPK